MPDAFRPRTRFHGRIDSGRACAAPGCAAAGEFRAPLTAPTFDGPGTWQWLCLDHVRAFNARYNFFDGMSAEEIVAAQRPLAGWERETRAFAQGGADPAPTWGDFRDPLDAISARFAARGASQAGASPRFSAAERRALTDLGLGEDADLKAVRAAYSTRVRRYHPDRNGGDRSHEAALQRTLAAWAILRKAPALI